MSKKDKKKDINITIDKKTIITFIGCLVLFALISLLIVTKNISWFDNGVYNIVSKMICEPMTFVFKTITLLCEYETILLLLLAFFIFMKKKKVAFLIALNSGLCVLVNQLVKHIFLRTRPVGIALIKQGGYSFPSGHSMIAMAFYGLLIYMIQKSKLSKNKKVIFTVLLSMLVILVGLSRIYLGVHFASDILGGFALALAYLILFINFVYKKEEN